MVGVLLILALFFYGVVLVPKAGRLWADACHSDVVKAQPAHVRGLACPLPAQPKPVKAHR